MDTWKQYSGMWPLQAQMQAAAVPNWPGSNLALYSWGANNYGQLGQRDVIYRSYPTQVGNLNDWLVISNAGTVSAAIKVNNTLWTWGYNTFGGLGQNDRAYRSSPTQVGALTNWQAVAVDAWMLAVKTDGTLWSWGANGEGPLGLNDRTYRSSPVQVGSLTNWKQVAVANASSYAVKTDGTVWSWGGNTNGELGQNNLTNRSSPVQIGALTDWSNVYADLSGTAVGAIKTNNSLWTWGRNQSGQLGQGDVVYRSSPTQVGALTNWRNLSNRGSQFFISTKTDNTLWSWGVNNDGNLGQNSTVSRSSPVQVGALTTWSKVSAGTSTGWAVKTDGTLWAWGAGAQGQLGNNDVNGTSSPIQIGSSNSWVDIYGGTYMNLALYKA